MKKIFVILSIIVLLISSVYAKNNDKLDVNSGSFIDIGRYTGTFEINDEINENDTTESDPENFELYSIIDVAERYEKNAIELKLDNDVTDTLNSLNSERMFELKVNEAKYNIENSIKNENIIWDSSKSFLRAYFDNSRHMAPIPSIINSSKITSNIQGSITASLGQTSLNDANGTPLLFVRANESTYNIGSVISYKGNAINLSTGSFSSSYNHASSGGFILSSNEINLPYNSGSILLGSGYFVNEYDTNDKYTGGSFIEYKYKNLKLNAQISQSRFSNSDDYNTSFYFIPEFKISDSLYLKTRFIRNITQQTMQDEFAITYRPKNNKNNFEFEINTTNQYTQNETINRRIKFSTSFKI